MAAAAIFLTFLGLLLFFNQKGISAASDCEPGKWEQIYQDDLYKRLGCASVSESKIKFVSYAINLSKYHLLLGSASSTGTPLTLSTVPNDLVDGQQFSLKKFMESRPKLLVGASVGYPIDPADPPLNVVPEGLVRIGGDDYSERDTVHSFKSALFCLRARPETS